MLPVGGKMGAGKLASTSSTLLNAWSGCAQTHRGKLGYMYALFGLCGRARQCDAKHKYCNCGTRNSSILRGNDAV